jgi:gas vesicle protein
MLPGANDPIEELSVSLVANASDFLNGIEESLEQGIESLDEFADQWRDDMGELAEWQQQLGLSFNMAMGLHDGDFAESMQAVINVNRQVVDSLNVSEAEILAYAEAMQSQVAPMVEDAYTRIADAAAEAGIVIDREAENLIRRELEFAATSRDTLPEAEQHISNLTDEIIATMPEASQKANEFDNAMKQLGAGLLNLFGVVGIAALVTTALRDLQRFFTVGTEMAIESTAAFREFEIQIRRLQRTLGDGAGTISDWEQFAETLSDEFGTDRRENLAQITDVLSRLTGELRLNAEQMQQVIRAGQIYDAVNGDIQNSAEKLARFVQGGQVESLRNLGVSYNEALVEAAKFELGITKATEEMTEQEEMLVRLQVVMTQANQLAGDAASVQDTLAGRMDNVNQRLAENQLQWGNFLAIPWVGVQEIFLQVSDAVLNLSRILVVLSLQWVAFWFAMGAGLQEGARQLKGFLSAGDDFSIDSITGAFEGGMEEALGIVSQIADAMMGKFGELGDVSAEELGSIGMAADDMSQNVQEAFEKASDALDDAIARWEEGLARARQSLEDKLADIFTDAARRREDLETDLQRDLADMERDAQRDKIQAVEEAQQDELNLREEFMRDMRDLEDRYLMDLEDALRDRDARRVLELLRRMNDEKQKRTDDFELRRSQRKEELKEELEDIDENLDFQRKMRRQAFQRELQDLAQQTQRRIADAHLSYQRQLRDLQRSIETRLRLVAEGLTKELQLNQSGLETLYQMLNQAYGSGGWVEAFYLRYMTMLAYMGSSGPTSGYVSSGSSGGFGSGTAGRNVSAYARGAVDMLVTQPQTIQVGEQPELINIVPLNRGSGLPKAGFGSRRGGNDRIELRVTVEEGLKAQIIDNTMGEVADIMTRVQRKGA